MMPVLTNPAFSKLLPLPTDILGQRQGRLILLLLGRSPHQQRDEWPQILALGPANLLPFCPGHHCGRYLLWNPSLACHKGSGTRPPPAAAL